MQKIRNRSNWRLWVETVASAATSRGTWATALAAVSASVSAAARFGARSGTCSTQSEPITSAAPVAAVVGQPAKREDVIAFLADRVAKWWLPDAIEFLDEIPKTSSAGSPG